MQQQRADHSFAPWHKLDVPGFMPEWTDPILTV